MKMKREVQNYIFLAIGFGIILLFFIQHLLIPLNHYLTSYNKLVEWVNGEFYTNLGKKEAWFFGDNFQSFVFLIDIIMVIIVLLICLLVFLKIYWSVKNQ